MYYRQGIWPVIWGRIYGAGRSQTNLERGRGFRKMEPRTYGAREGKKELVGGHSPCSAVVSGMYESSQALCPHLCEVAITAPIS